MPLLVLVLLACALAFTACGGDDDQDATELLAQTFGGGGEDVKSGRLDLSVRLNAQGLAELSGPVTARMSGPFQSTGKRELPRFDFNVAFGAQGQDIKAGAVSTGDKGFLRFDDQAYDIGADLFKQFRDGYAEQAKCTEEQGDKGGGVTFQALGVDPRRWLREANKAGEEEVGGAETVHISSRIDVPRFLEDINRVLSRTDLQQRQADPCNREPDTEAEKSSSRQLSEQDRKQIAEAIKDARVDVWTGKDDKIMRRLNVALRFDVPEAGRRQARGLRSGDLRFDMTLGAVNEDQEIKAPSGAQPLEQLGERLGGQVPGLGGAGAPAPGAAAPGDAAPGAVPGTGGTAAPGGEQSSEYLACVAQAGNDVVKLQACQDKVGR
jgi:hypothetical protein